jgi:hypothetical protein
MKTIAVAVDSWASNRLDVFGIGVGNAMFHKAWAAGSWSPSQTSWESVGGTFTSPPAVVSWGPNRLDVFGIGTDNTVYHKSWAAGAWSPSQTGWESLGGALTSPPAVVSWGANRIDVFAIGTDNGMYHKTWDGSGAWSPSQTGWFSLGGSFTSPPAVVSWGLGRFDIFGIGADATLYHKAYTADGWSPSQTGWDALGGSFESPPAVVSWAPNRLDVFGIGTDGGMYHKSWADGAWSPSQTDWESLGGAFTSLPAAASWAANRLDVFGIGTDNTVYHKAWADGAWDPSQTGWESLGGTFLSAPAVASWGANRLDVFGIGSDNSVYHKSWGGTGAWSPSQTGWESLGGQFTIPLVQVPAPGGGLGSNNNYFLEDGGKPLTGVVVTIKFEDDFISTNNGYSFQLNCYSTEGPSITTEWQQFVIWSSNAFSGLVARIDTWSGIPAGDELNRIDASLVSLPTPPLGAGYTLTIALTYLPGSYDVSGANYSLTDETGATLGTASIAIIGQNLRTTGNAATAANLAPIAALQFNIGGDYNRAVASLSGGAGTITYTADNLLNVVNSEPSYTDFDDGTGETANLTFGELPGVTASRVITQSFQATPGVPAPRIVTRRGHALPPPDTLSLGSKAKPK